MLYAMLRMRGGYTAKPRPVQSNWAAAFETSGLWVVAELHRFGYGHSDPHQSALASSRVGLKTTHFTLIYVVSH